MVATSNKHRVAVAWQLMNIAPKMADLPPCGLAPKDMVAQYLGQTAPKVYGA